MSEYADIETHSDNGYNSHPAIKVKYYGRMPASWDDLSDDVRSMLWDQVVEDWWEQARLGQRDEHERNAGA